ncbi:hypothetical protein [Bradyrhizobium sp. SZCCHNRI2049]|uniref:hypothetical protein n=1 Tax=Bradyrhizobium sp. SZCCHNRI2049 TaxID=3057287 RepID=UPI002916BCE4|nr:hypothetical protein [Bradyrhizobium sp. SZCCHNRI2049]
MYSPNSETMFGRSMVFWHEIAVTLDRHRIDTPASLDKKLTEKANAGRVEVYDMGNGDRLLGTVPKPEFNGGRQLRMLCMPRALASYYSPRATVPDTIETTSITLECGVRRGPNPLDVRGVLSTAACLRDLMLVRDFRLPGESEWQAEQRRYCA